jgi:transposase-like protein
MATANREPETLLEAVRYFSDPEIALRFVAGMKWPNGVICPRCHSKSVGFLSTRRLWKCKGCAKQFSAKVGTIFEDSPIPLEKWLPAVWLLANCKNGISSYELGRALGVTQKTAWFMLSRVRLMLQSKGGGKLGGDIEADESYIGGKARNMHKGKRDRVIKGRGPNTKTAVFGLLERNTAGRKSRVRVSVVPNIKRHRLHSEIRANVEAGSNVYTDALHSYRGLDADYVHGVIDHAEAYVQGEVHTNGLENFWSLLKRAIRGTYVSIEPFHLFRYLDEQSFRFNEREGNDRSRFLSAMSNLFGRRLTYSALTGSELPQT